VLQRRAIERAWIPCRTKSRVMLLRAMWNLCVQEGKVAILCECLGSFRSSRDLYWAVLLQMAILEFHNISAIRQLVSQWVHWVREWTFLQANWKKLNQSDRPTNQKTIPKNQREPNTSSSTAPIKMYRTSYQSKKPISIKQYRQWTSTKSLDHHCKIDQQFQQLRVL